MTDPEFPDRFFEREDETSDTLFYREPRFVAHIDDVTISALTAYYRGFLPTGCRILDLMSSWDLAPTGRRIPSRGGTRHERTGVGGQSTIDGLRRP